MDSQYLELLSKDTPIRSATKSSYIQKCTVFGSTKKGLSFTDASMMGEMAAGDQSLSFLSHVNEPVSNISGIFEFESSNRLQNSSLIKESTKLQTSLSKFPNIQGDFTHVQEDFIHTKGDYTHSQADFMQSQGNFMHATKGEFDTTTLCLDTNSGTYITGALFEDFLEFFLSYSGEHEVFDLLNNYEMLCCKSFEAISKIVAKCSATDANLNKIISMLNFLQLERNTWRLLRILFQDRLDAETMTEEKDLLAEMFKKSTDKEIIENLYQKDSYVRQLQLIVDWLEKNAEEDFQHTFFDKFEYFADKCMALEHTLNELATTDFNKHQRGMREMDPDAPFRQESFPLHETDRENEARLFKFMFLYIRAGKLDEAQKLAERFGEPWLAAVLEGWRLHHDPNYETELVEGQELLPIEGNQYRDLWKATCWSASQSPIVPVYEQAVYASLCGNLKSMLSVCKTWEDYLWAYTRASLDKLMEKEIRSSSYERKLQNLPADYWDKLLDIDEIFQELEASDSNGVKSNSKNPYRIIQKYIILDDLGGLIEEMFLWLRNGNLDGHVLRCMAHIILFFRVIGRSIKEELSVPILEAYVQELIKANKVSLVAPYTSTLPKDQQIFWYAKFLEGITDKNERQQCLQFAEDAGLDVSQITKTVVKNIREKDSGSLEPSTDLSVITTKEDLQKIHAIDWLIFNPSQRAEAVKQANALMRVFIAQRKTEAANLLFAKIPEDSVAVMMQLAKAKGLEELPADDDNATREYLCFKAYLEAIDAYNNWFHQSIHAVPKKPTPPSGEHVTFKAKVAHEHELQQYHQDLERWQRVVDILAETASGCLYNVLLFVNGGWMIDQRTDGTPDSNRQHQLAHLRKLCIPQVTRLLQDLLKNGEKYKEAIQLADFISSERYQLYKEFTHEELKQFMRVTLDSSFALLDKNMDPLGYSVQ